MKRSILIFVFAAMMFVAGSQTIVAQQTRRLRESPKAFQTFFAKFKAAVEKSDKTAIAAMTKFPFKYGFDAGDEGTMTREQFVRRFADVFGESPKQFLPEKNPRVRKNKDNSYTVSTEDAAHLLFEPSGGGFKFAALMVEP
jgi:hypothetical protein